MRRLGLLLLSWALASQFSVTVVADVLSVSRPIDEASPTVTPSSKLSGANNINSAIVVPLVVAAVSVFVAFLLVLCLKVPVPRRFLHTSLRSRSDDDATLRDPSSRVRFSWFHRKGRSKSAVWPHSVYNGGQFQSNNCGNKLEMRVVEEIPEFPGHFRTKPLSRQDTEKMSQSRIEEEAESRIRAMLDRMNPEDRAWASEQLIYGQTDALRAASIGQAY